jgi:hypothetical protein
MTFSLSKPDFTKYFTSKTKYSIAITADDSVTKKFPVLEDGPLDVALFWRTQFDELAQLKNFDASNKLPTFYDRNLPTSGLDSGSSWLDGVNGILMQQEPDSPKQDYWNRRAIASLANTSIRVVEPVPMPLLSSMPLLQL